LIHDLYSNRV